MSVSIVAQFVDAFIGGFFGTIKEKLIDGGLLIAGLIYWLLSGTLRTHFWENVLPWIWVGSVIVFWHSIAAAISVSRHARTSTVPSAVLSPSGAPIEAVIRGEPFVRVKAFSMAAMLCAVMMVLSFLAYEKSRSAEKHLSPTAANSSVASSATNEPSASAVRTLGKPSADVGETKNKMDKKPQREVEREANKTPKVEVPKTNRSVNDQIMVNSPGGVQAAGDVVICV